MLPGIPQCPLPNTLDLHTPAACTTTTMPGKQRTEAREEQQQQKCTAALLAAQAGRQEGCTQGAHTSRRAVRRHQPTTMRAAPAGPHSVYRLGRTCRAGCGRERPARPMAQCSGGDCCNLFLAQAGSHSMRVYHACRHLLMWLQLLQRHTRPRPLRRRPIVPSTVSRTHCQARQRCSSST